MKARSILEEGYALRAADIDVIYLTGYGFPAYRGGPMWYADTVGLKKVRDRIAEFHQKHGEFWEPAPLLNKLADQGETFAGWDSKRDAARESKLAARIDDFGSHHANDIYPRPFARCGFLRRPLNPFTRPDGSLVVRPLHPLGPYPDKLTERLDHWAAQTPDRVFLADRDRSGAWRTATYAQMRASARNVAQALLDRPLSAERPVAILSGNDIEHAALGLGAMYAGIPFAPISPAYSLVSSDFGKLRLIFDILTPGLVFVSAGAPFRKALEAVLPPDAELVISGDPSGLHATPFSVLETTAASSAVDRAHAAVGPDTIAKFLFTSGSTGTPKGVINTQRMLCSNQEIVRTMLPFVEDDPPVLCDWLPWNHTFAGNHDFGLVLYNGGSYYIDDGRPVAGAIDATIRNLDDVQPTIYLNVPRGLRNGSAVSARSARFSRSFLQKAALNVLRGRRSFTAGVGRTAGTGGGILRRAYPDVHRPRLHRNRSVGDVPVLGRRSRRTRRPACAGRRAEAGEGRRENRSAAAQSQHHARLLAATRFDAGCFRRGGILSPGRRAALRRS